MDCEGHQRGPDVEVLEHWEGCWRIEDELYLGLVDQIFIFCFEYIEKVCLRKVVLSSLKNSDSVSNSISLEFLIIF